MLAIAQAGRTRWKIENEGFNCLKNQGYHLEHNFGHGQQGLANTLATINLFAFALHQLLDCVCPLWRRWRRRCYSRKRFIERLVKSVYDHGFPDWRSLFRAFLRQRARAG